ncbi:lysine--tRNA ligase [Haladaptatus sp. DJG-WS-42]|uniref:lysine--tRNA ligase n=1 Tax=Haladaptatus sp. DJG-WS-42 TaxID=3120516 RepID=UPI0030D366B7
MSDDAGDHRVFWADEVADQIEARDPEDPIIIKGGVSPSGIPHIGHLNEILRGYFVAEVLRERGHEVRQIFTSDDKDPLRKIPRRLAALDFTIKDLGDLENPGALGRNLGKPLTSVPDPFGCCESFGEHQTKLLEKNAKAVGVPIEVVSNTELYAEGKFDDVVAYLLENQQKAAEVLSEYQDKVDAEYIPFNPVCENCGKLTETVLSFDVAAGTVEYECTNLKAGGNVIDGCGHTGTATFREGKLPWRFEWPAQWQVLKVDHEPFGKDHAAGSWPSGKDIAENVLGNEAPVPMVYEWFTYNGEALSSSAGNVVTAHEILELLEPEVFKYFFSLTPKKARDFDVSRLNQLVDDFDRFEHIYFDRVTDEDLKPLADRVYPFLVDEVKEDRVRLPYTFAAVLGMTDDVELREEMARNEEHFTDETPDWAVEDALQRVEKARNWAERLDNEYNYRLQVELPETAFDDATQAALSDLAAFVEAGHDGEEIQGEIYETAKRHDVGVGDFFTAGYRLFFDAEQGPRLGTFLGELDREFVVTRLRREG